MSGARLECQNNKCQLSVDEGFYRTGARHAWGTVKLDASIAHLLMVSSMM
jgi:hypothetical protein